MRYASLLTSLLLVLFTSALAGPCLTSEKVDQADYVQWLEDKHNTWTREISQIQNFAPEQVRSMQGKLRTIQSKAQKLKASKSPDEIATLKDETHQLVFALERELEQTFAELDHAFGPPVVFSY